MARPEKLRLGELLVGQKLISQEQLKIVLDQQRRTGRKLGRLLIENGFVTEDKLADALARQFGLPCVNLRQYDVRPELVRRLPEAQARRLRALVLEDRGTSLLVAMGDPTDLFAFDELGKLLKTRIDVAVATDTQLLETIDRTYRRTEEITGLARALEANLRETVADLSGPAAGATEDAPVVRLIQSMFEDAMQVGASDIHIEPQEEKLQVRFRIDGILHPQAEADVKIAPAVALRLKIMAGLDISEKRLPQDGRFHLLARNEPLDVRISCMPTQYGESVVMRLLRPHKGLLGLDRLGMPPAMLARYREIVSRTTGMVLVTGPTGSGKTTTLYATLAEINGPDKKIITVEDPVEYRLPGINQVQVNEKIELTFSRVLRSVLRQDPDVILVGEIRDEETVQIGLRAAITGHMVFSTLHTRDAAATPLRLMDMGAPAYLVASSLQAVLAQRLVRTVCENCAQPYSPEPRELQWLAQALRGELPAAPGFRRGRGCRHCNRTGYAGRTGVYEMLEMTPELVAAANREDPAGFVAAARAQIAGSSLQDHAIRLALEGRSTVAEVMRVATEAEE
jgi:MSHA biogenesis protein MshE